jgi:hypothetical protein
MKNRKTPPHSAGPNLAHGPGTAGLAGPADGTTWARTAVITCRTAAVVRLTRLADGVLGDKVLPTMTGTLLGDDPARWGGRALTKVTWHRWGWRNGVGGGVRRWRQSSSDRRRLRWCPVARRGHGESEGRAQSDREASEAVLTESEQRWRQRRQLYGRLKRTGGKGGREVGLMAAREWGGGGSADDGTASLL